MNETGYKVAQKYLEDAYEAFEVVEMANRAFHGQLGDRYIKTLDKNLCAAISLLKIFNEPMPALQTHVFSRDMKKGNTVFIHGRMFTVKDCSIKNAPVQSRGVAAWFAGPNDPFEPEKGPVFRNHLLLTGTFLDTEPML